MFKLNLYQSLAATMAKNLGLPEEDREVLAYGLEILVTTVAGTALALVAAAILGLFYQALAVLVVPGLIRKLAGGAHLSTPWRCFTASTVSLSFLGWLALLVTEWFPAVVILTAFFLTAGLAVALTVRFAPADTVSKPITNLQQRRFLRRAAIITEVLLAAVTSAAFLAGYLPGWGVSAVALGFAWQALFIAPIGYRLAGGVDTLISRLIPKRKEVETPCRN